MQCLKKNIKMLIPSKILCKMQKIHFHVVLKMKGKSYLLTKRKSWGKENKGKTYYIYRSGNTDVGILVFYARILTNIEKILAENVIPIIDFEKEENFFHDKVGLENQWEYCFEQPEGIHIEDIRKSNKVILGGFQFHNETTIHMITENYREYYNKWNRIAEKYIPVRADLKKEWDEFYEKLFSTDKVLGICLREDFRYLHEENLEISKFHPNEPILQDIIECIKEYKEKWNCKKIFVTTMFQETINILEEFFGEDLIYIERAREKMADQAYRNYIKGYQATKGSKKIIKYINEETTKREVDGNRKDVVISYVKEMYGLSKCCSILGTRCGGMRVALIWNGGEYENIKTFNEEQNKKFY